MVIDKIGNTNKILNGDKIQNPKTREISNRSGESDSVSISNEAQKAQTIAQVTSYVKAAPDIREDKVKEVKEKLAKGYYDDPENKILEKVAEKIADALIRA